MMNFLKQHAEEHKSENLQLMENNKKFCYQIIHELLNDEEFAKKTLPVIRQNAFPWHEVKYIIGSMKDYYTTTGRVPSVEVVKQQIAERFHENIDVKIMNDLVDHCNNLELNGTRKEEVHFHWNTVYCMFYYIALLNELYGLAHDSEGIFLSQYKLMKQMAESIEDWRKKFYSDEGVQEVLGGNIKNEGFINDWD